MRLSKLEAAEIQIEVACRLLMAGESLLAIHTLAGASEEILGRLAERAHETNMFQRLHAAAEEKAGHPMSVSEVSLLANESRNLLKHAKDPREDFFSYDPDHAVVMLFRAMVNYQLVTGVLTDTMESACDVLRRTHPGFFEPTAQIDG